MIEVKLPQRIMLNIGSAEVSVDSLHRLQDNWVLTHSVGRITDVDIMYPSKTVENQRELVWCFELRTSSLKVPGLAVGVSSGKQLEKDRGHLKALVPVQRWFRFEDLHCLSDLSGIVVSFTGQNSKIVKREALSRTFYALLIGYLTTSVRGSTCLKPQI